MKVIVVGSGGREHALTWKLAQSPEVKEVICAPGNAGTATIGKNKPVGTEDIYGLTKLAKNEGAGLVVVGPETPLALGLADQLLDEGIPVFGPQKAAAQIEASKSFSKNLMKAAGIPTASFGVFDHPLDAKVFVRERGGAWAVKADGLAAGKGVLICPEPASAESAITEIMEGRSFGEAGERCVVEEFLEGEEASLLAFVDGNEAILMPSAQDHKSIGEGDTGPNTGGMGAYSPAPVMTPKLEKRALNEVIQPAVDEMARRGTPYRGVLYAGLMIQNDSFKVLEFNCRFGDPECQPLLMRLESDLLAVLLACAEGDLSKTKVSFSNESAACIVMASKGYPGNYRKGDTIFGLEAANEVEGSYIFHAGTALDREGKTLTSGGRVLGVTARGKGIQVALERAYEAARRISWEGAYYRKDIGAKALHKLI